MEYYYKCFNRILKLKLNNNKVDELDFWLQRFCPNLEILNNNNCYNVDFNIECVESNKCKYILEDKNIKLYGSMNNYASFLAKFITQVFQKLLIDDSIVFIPAACVSNINQCILVIGDFWQGKTSTALNIAQKYNLNLISDNYIAVSNLKVIGATKYISKREEDADKNDNSLLKINNRYFYNNPYFSQTNKLEIIGFVLPYINSSDNNIHLISKEESTWYLYQKITRLLSGETILFNGVLPSPIFLDNENSKKILSIVNELLSKNYIKYISSNINTIVEESIKIFIDRSN